MLKFCLCIMLVAVLFADNYDTSLDRTTVPITNKINHPVFTPQPPLVNQFSSPDGATRGLAFDGTFLWSADNGDGNSQNGKKIYKLDPNNGTIINSYNPPGVYPNGLTWDGAYLWHSDHGTGMIYKIDTTSMTVVKQFSAPGASPFDLAWDGEYLYAVKGGTNLISKIDTATGNEIGTILCDYSSPNVRPFGLAYFPFNSGQIWTSDGNYGSNYVNEYDFASSSWIDQWPGDPSSYPCGIAYDPITGYMWLSCWTNDMIYVYDAGTPGIADHGINRVTHTDLKIFPNPAFDHVTIEYALSGKTTVDLTIYNAAGAVVKKLARRIDGPENHTIVVNTSSLPADVYYVMLKTDGYVEVEKLVKFR